MPLFLLPRPLLAQAERVWWGVSGSISLRTEGGRARREGGGREAIPTASPGSSCLYLYIYFRTLLGAGARAGARAARLGLEPRDPGRSLSACGSRSGRLPSGLWTHRIIPGSASPNRSY